MPSRALALAALLAGCASSDVTAPRPGQEFTLGVGQHAAIVGTGLQVVFVGVLEDSRCPSDAYCVWAGDALVELRTVTRLGARTDTLHTGIEPRDVTREGRRLELVDVTPYPRAAVPVDPKTYRATLLVR